MFADYVLFLTKNAMLMGNWDGSLQGFLGGVIRLQLWSSSDPSSLIDEQTSMSFILNVATMIGNYISQCFVFGVGLAVVALWMVCSGLLRRCFLLLRMLPIVGNMIGLQWARMVPDWYNVLAMIIRDLESGSVERVVFHIFFLKNSALEPMEEFIYFKTTGATTLSMTVCVVVYPVLCSLAMYNTAAISTSAWKILVMHAISSIMLAQFLKNVIVGCSYVMHAPLKELYRHIHDRIRDENYLTGRELQNSSQHSKCGEENNGA